MYICIDCNATFDEFKWIIEPHGEKTPCCPQCNGNFVPAEKCRVCGQYFDEEDLKEGYCDKCLKEQLTFENFRAYASEGYEDEELSMLEEFVLNHCFDLSFDDMPTGSSKKLKELLYKTYDEYINDEKEKILNGRLTNGVKFQIDDYMFGEMWEFAEYLAERSEKGARKD